MRQLSKTQVIAVAVSIGLLTYIFFGETLLNFFNSPIAENITNTSTKKMETNDHLKTRELTTGQGENAEKGDVVTVHYVGRLTDGRVFDSSLDRGTPFKFILGSGEVIKGWDEGVLGMKVGGKRELVIAPDYAYGSRGVGSIPPNSTLIFEVELLEVEKR